MSSSIRTKKTSAVALGSSVALVPIAFAGPAFAAADYDCGGDPGVTVMGGGICWYSITPTDPEQVSSGTFTAPAGIDTVTTLLVGGGGGSYLEISEFGYATAYGGGAGEVLLYESVPSTAPISYNVGRFGYYDYDESEPVHGGDTSISGYTAARGGKTATFEVPAASGNGNDGADNINLTVSDGTLEAGGGGGSAGDALTSSTLPDAGKGGAGTTWESLNSPLFDPSKFDPDMLGGDDIEDVPPIASGGTVFEGNGLGIPSAGDGGSIVFINDWDVTDDYDAFDGAVVFAWMDPNYDASEDDGQALPETGSPVQPLTIVGALGALFAGAIALTRRRERV